MPDEILINLNKELNEIETIEIMSNVKFFLQYRIFEEQETVEGFDAQSPKSKLVSKESLKGNQLFLDRK